MRRRKVLEFRRSVGMTQHALWREDDERLAPRAASLATQHVEILRGAGWLANLHIVFPGELQKAFDAGAGMFWPLAFKSMREQQHAPGGEIPPIFPRAEELVDYALS